MGRWLETVPPYVPHGVDGPAVMTEEEGSTAVTCIGPALPTDCIPFLAMSCRAISLVEMDADNCEGRVLRLGGGADGRQHGVARKTQA